MSLDTLQKAKINHCGSKQQNNNPEETNEMNLLNFVKRFKHAGHNACRCDSSILLITPLIVSNIACSGDRPPS